MFARHAFFTEDGIKLIMMTPQLRNYLPSQGKPKLAVLSILRGIYLSTDQNIFKVSIRHSNPLIKPISFLQKRKYLKGGSRNGREFY